MWAAFLHAIGADYGGRYGRFIPGAFWSGIAGSCAVNAVLFAAGFWWHHQCAVSRCWWYARRVTAAGERACFLHHPHRRRTAAEVRAAHHAALGVPHMTQPPHQPGGVA